MRRGERFGATFDVYVKMFSKRALFSCYAKTHACSRTLNVLMRARVVLRPHVNLSDSSASSKIRPFYFYFFKNLIERLKTLATSLYGAL